MVQISAALSPVGHTRRGRTHSLNLHGTERFVCRMYNCDQVDTADKVCTTLFFKASKPEHMPPTSNALRFHLIRSQYQALVWKQTICTDPALRQPQEMGWQLDGELLNPTLLSLDPIPNACHDVTHCTCRTSCRIFRCSCRKAIIFCTRACVCKKVIDAIHNFK